MNLIGRVSRRIFSFVIVATIASIFAQAQATRTWISGVGDDVNPCSRTAPCKTFAGAISKTAVGGEINCLDPGGFGTVTITKSITLDCSGTFGSILASGTNGIVINITDTGDAIKTVRIRGLSINGAGSGGPTGLNGVRIISAAKVFIENVVIDGFTKNGISIENTVGTQVSIYRSNIRNNDIGIIAAPTTGGASEVSVSESLIAGNNTGISAGANSIVQIAGNSITFNKTGVNASSGGKINSFKNNVIDSGGRPTVSTVPLILQ
jgi:Right handed beta helix region